MYPPSPLPSIGSWRRSSCSGWKYSVSSVLQGMRLTHCKSPWTGWRCVEFPYSVSSQGYSDQIQVSPTFDLANDCFRFVTGYLEVISASSRHIYHSALVVAPRNSIVRKLYELHAHPLTRIACGAPISWEASTAATARPSRIWRTVWSPCDRFIAITWIGTKTVDVLDSTTLQRLQTVEFPQDIHRVPGARFLPGWSCFDVLRLHPHESESLRCRASRHQLGPPDGWCSQRHQVADAGTAPVS